MTLSNEKLDIAMAKLAINKTELAERAGISRNRLCVLMNSKVVTAVAVGKIAKALGVDVTEIIE